ncbi:MAG: hypothetical protein ABIH39_04290 [Candidatus Margulisiibacteriota bacterium]
MKKITLLCFIICCLLIYQGSGVYTFNTTKMFEKSEPPNSKSRTYIPFFNDVTGNKQDHISMNVTAEISNARYKDITDTTLKYLVYEFIYVDIKSDTGIIEFYPLSLYDRVPACIAFEEVEDKILIDFTVSDLEKSKCDRVMSIFKNIIENSGAKNYNIITSNSNPGRIGLKSFKVLESLVTVTSNETVKETEKTPFSRWHRPPKLPSGKLDLSAEEALGIGR